MFSPEVGFHAALVNCLRFRGWTIADYENECILDRFVIDIHSGWTRLLAAR
jgi:hypothetical protein